MSLPMLRKCTPTVVVDDKGPVMGEEGLMFDAAPTTEPEGGVSNDFRTAVLTRDLDKYCRFLDFPFQ